MINPDNNKNVMDVFRVDSSTGSWWVSLEAGTTPDTMDKNCSMAFRWPVGIFDPRVDWRHESRSGADVMFGPTSSADSG